MRIVFSQRFPSCSATALPPQKGSTPRIAVIGGGAAGLATAGRLARAGLRVTLLEKNDTVGGRLQSEHLETPTGRWRFDTGPSLLLFLEKYQETFAALGARMEDVVEVRRVSPAAYRVFFPSSPGFRIDLLNDVEAMASQLESVEKGAADGYLRFLAMAKRNLALGVPYFIDRQLDELEDAKGLLDLLPQLSSINPWQLLGPHDYVMRSFFSDPRLRASFTFQDLYVGLSPSTAPAVFSLLAGTEVADGVYYPLGGFGAVRDALLAAIEAAGVAVKTRAEVSSIDVDDAGCAVGVTLSTGEHIPAEVVICNRDLPAAYSLLQSREAGGKDALGLNGSGGNDAGGASFDVKKYVAERQQKLFGMKYSAGVIAFNWAVRGQLPELMHHNVFLSEEFRQAWKPAAAPSQFVTYPNFYVHVPTRTDAAAAPQECESVMVLLPVTNTQRLQPVEQDYNALIEAGRENVLKTLETAGVGDLRPMIEREMVIDPREWQRRYGLQYGAAFGLSHGLSQLSIFRPPSKDPEVRGLYFVGASTRPGNGVPLCFIGAKLTADKVLKDLAERSPGKTPSGVSS